MYYKITLIIVTLFLLTSCSDSKPKQLKISVTTWIGYTPLFYAKAKGWLKPLSIKLLNVSSLSENMNVYKAGKSDAFVGTQYELNKLNDNNIIPIMMFDRSNGGDVIMSNVTLTELQTTEDKVDAYLEIDSVNSTLLNSFVNTYNLAPDKINYINQDQTQISVLNYLNLKNNTVIITYNPYNYQLEKNGFKEIASTKENLNLLVVDAMFTSKKVFSMHKNQFVESKKIVDISIENLNKNPKEYYETIKPYLLEISYEEFLDSTSDIVWINKRLDEELVANLEKDNFHIRSLF